LANISTVKKSFVFHFSNTRCSWSRTS